MISLGKRFYVGRGILENFIYYPKSHEICKAHARASPPGPINETCLTILGARPWLPGRAIPETQ
jgi:hypothetical protein